MAPGMVRLNTALFSLRPRGEIWYKTAFARGGIFSPCCRAMLLTPSPMRWDITYTTRSMLPWDGMSSAGKW